MSQDPTEFNEDITVSASTGAEGFRTEIAATGHALIGDEPDSVGVRHTKIHAYGCAEPETTMGRIDEFKRQIVLEGDLDDAARQRLLEIADLCPVHRSLTNEVQIVTSLDR